MINVTKYKVAILVSLAILLTTPLSLSSAMAATASYTSQQAPKANDIQGLTFRSVSVTVNNKRYSLASKDPISLSFKDKMIGISAGCNSLDGMYLLSKGILITQTLFSSKMACSDRLMSQDVWLNQLFSSKPKLQIQFLTPKSKIKTPTAVLMLNSNLTPNLKSGKTVIKMNLYETIGFADTPLGDEKSTKLIKETCDYLILSKATETEAQSAAEQNGLTFRVTGREGENYPTTMDYSLNRMNVVILDGKVSECSQG